MAEREDNMGQDLVDQTRSGADTTKKALQAAKKAKSSGTAGSAAEGAAGAGVAGETAAGAETAAGGSSAASGGTAAGSAAGGSAAGGAAGAGAAAGGAAALPIIAVCILFFLIICVVMTVGTPSTSFNSWTHINEIQDPVDDDELNPDGTVRGDADGDKKALGAEAEGINLIYNVLADEEIAAYEELKDQCDKSGVNYEATKAFMTRIGSAGSSSEIFSVTDDMTEDETGFGYYTQDQFEACEILSTYSISVDNLWGKDYLGDGEDELLGIDPNSIDISSMEGKAKYMYVMLRRAGYSHNAACGIMGNIHQESHFNPTLVNYLGASGIVQWCYERAPRMKKAVEASAGSWKSYKGQVKYMIKELKGYKTVEKTLRGNPSLADATWIVLRRYEAPGNYQAEQKTRLGFAKQWSKKFKSLGAGTAGTSTKTAPGALGAVQWARAIAKDNSFNYGVGSYAHRGGCYFCRNSKGQTTNRRIKGMHSSKYGNNYQHGWSKKWDKTYCCNSFVFAAYAHGSGDKFMLKECKKGHNGKYWDPSDWKKCHFRVLGHIPYSKLRTGDIIRMSGHYYMVTDPKKNKYIDSGHEGWDAGSIAERSGLKGMYGSSHIVIRYYGNGQGGSVTTSDTAVPQQVSSSGADAALRWAKKIASDNSYIYQLTNTCSKCHKGVSKTYCCASFVRAAYAHGAKDKRMLTLCKSSSAARVDILKEAMRKDYRNWKRVGTFANAKKKLKPGDVLFRGNDHVEIYAGHNKRVGAHGIEDYSAPDSISMLSMNSNWTEVYRYQGGGSGITPKKYKKFTVIKTIRRSSVKEVCYASSTSLPTAESMALVGKNIVAVCMTDIRGNMRDGKRSQVWKYKLGSGAKQRPYQTSATMDLDHGNGMTYDPNAGELYSAHGWQRPYAKRVNAKTLAYSGTIDLNHGAGAIAYDRRAKTFCLGSGDRITVTNEKFKRKKTIAKMAPYYSAQDIGAAGGIIYCCVSVDKHNKNYISMYNEKTGDYYGSYALNWNTELEDCEIMNDGRLLLLCHQKGDHVNYVYMTKKPLALSADGEVESEAEAGNWRYDMPNRLRQYIQGEREKGNKPVYELNYVYDSQTGEPREFTGVYNKNTVEDDPKKHDKIVADGKSKKTSAKQKKKKTGGTNRRSAAKRSSSGEHHKKTLADEEETKRKEEFEIGNRAKDEALRKEAAQRKKPKLVRSKFIMTIMQKKDIVKLGFEAFGVSNEKVAELYGSYAEGSDAVVEMASNSLAILHNVQDFSKKYKIEPQYTGDGGDSEAEALDYELGAPLGKYHIYFACGCGKKSCTEHMAALGVLGIKDATPGVSLFTSDAKALRLKTIVHHPKLGCMIVDGRMKKMKKPSVTLYLGKDHKEAVKMMNRVRWKENNSSSWQSDYEFRLVEKTTEEDVRAYGNNISGSSGRGWIWPSPKAKIKTSGVGPRWGRHHDGLDISGPGCHGTPILASKGGKVVSAGWSGGYGNCVVIDHGGGWFSRYGHMSKITCSAKDRVRQGQKIGEIGDTGRSFGDHLHFEIRKGGQWGKVLDPEKYLPKNP